MQCLRCTRSLTAAARVVSRQSNSSIALGVASKRAFHAPTLLRPSTLSFAPSVTTTSSASATASSLDASALTSLTRKPLVSTHPALAGQQLRFAPRNTFSPSHFVRKRRHGFLSRLRTRKGRATLQRRKSKGRSTLSH